MVTFYRKSRLPRRPTFKPQKYGQPWLMFQPQITVNGDQSTELWPMGGGYMCPWHSAVEWPAVSTTTPNPVTSEPWRLRSLYHEIFIGLRWSQGYGSTLLAASGATESKHPMMHTIDNHASVTAFSCLGGTYHEFRYWLARVNGIMIHQDLGNRQPFD